MSQNKPDNDSQLEINFDGLRNAITPINLMFDGRLYKDVKGLTAHITQAMKKVEREKPDYQGAIIEINLLEAAVNSAVTNWEQKLTGEIQRLKNSVETAHQKSLGATKKISKYQEELTRGRASTRSLPIKIGQVRNQLIHARGNSPGMAASESETVARSRLVEKVDVLPVVYRNAAAQILRKVSQRGEERFVETALRVFKGISRPLNALEDQHELYQGRLYYVQPHDDAHADDHSQDDPSEHSRPEKALGPREQFLTIEGLNDEKSGYLLSSIFSDGKQSFEVSFEDFDQQTVFACNPLAESEIILQLLRARFQGEDFRETFRLYTSIRQKALASKRDEKFNPKQQVIHEYLTGLAFEFAGVSFDNRASEVRFTEQINNAIQIG